jgi:hypothetical protein
MNIEKTLWECNVMKKKNLSSDKKNYLVCMLMLSKVKKEEKKEKRKKNKHGYIYYSSLSRSNSDFQE